MRAKSSQRCVFSLVFAPSGRDCMGCAKTGSGKTAAFVLPVLQKLSEEPYGIFCLVLTPTRSVLSQSQLRFDIHGINSKGMDGQIVYGLVVSAQDCPCHFYQIMKVMRQVRSSVIQHKSAVAFIINTKKLHFLVFKFLYFQLTMHAVCGMSSRELAYQIAEQFRVLGKPLGLRDCIIVGGMGKNGLSCDSN